MQPAQPHFVVDLFYVGPTMHPAALCSPVTGPGYIVPDALMPSSSPDPILLLSPLPTADDYIAKLITLKSVIWKVSDLYL